MYFKDQNKKKAVTFSYDDGVTQDIRLIELLNQYGLKCTFNLNSETLGKKGTLTRVGKRISFYTIHPEDVKYIYDGHEVAVHTYGSAAPSSGYIPITSAASQEITLASTVSKLTAL